MWIALAVILLLIPLVVPESAAQGSLGPLTRAVDAPPLQFTRITVGVDGQLSNGDSGAPAISTTGRFVAFASSASNLVGDDTNGKADIFVYDRLTDRLTRDSLGAGGVQANDESRSPSITDDGRYVAFESVATNLVPGITSSTLRLHLYRRDRILGTTILIDSTIGGGVDPDWSSFDPVISDDGRYIAFDTASPNLVPNDPECWDVFVRDTAAAVTERVSAGTGPEICSADRPIISSDGRYVAFGSYFDHGNRHGVFVRDRVARLTLLESAGSEAFLDWAIWPSMSADGRFISWYRTGESGNPTFAGMYARDRLQGLTIGPVVSRPGEDWIFSRIGHNQPYVSYVSELRGILNGPDEPYLFDPFARAVIPLAPGVMADGISPLGGDALALASKVALVPTPTNYSRDIYVVTLASAGAPGVPRLVRWSVTGPTAALTWSGPAAGGAPSEYIVAAGTEPGRTDAAIIATGSSATMLTAGVPPPGRYYVRVHARNGAGTSGPSPEILVTVP